MVRQALLVGAALFGFLALPNVAQTQAFLDFTGPPTLVSGTAFTQGAQYRTAVSSQSEALLDVNVATTITESPSASLVIAKNDHKDATSTSGTNSYFVTLTNQGPSASNNAIVTDVVGAGLTCPPTNAVTCSVIGTGAVCPAGALTIASLTTGLTVATLPSGGALQFAYTCSVN